MMQCDASTERLVSNGALRLAVGLVGLVLFSFLTLGCGGDDPCAAKTCFFGECDSESGECVNKPSCSADEDCIPGFLCGENGRCAAANTCTSDDDCSPGVCEVGACVNPDRCQVNSDCLARTYCSAENTCAPDPCNSVTCDRGVCQRGTGNCINADYCTKKTPERECLPNHRCLENECVSRENYCDKLTCERGVCSFEEGGCVNADDCAGDRANCLEGYFCNKSDRCQEDPCVVDEIDCEEGGVCVPSTGECDNAQECDDDDECLPHMVCVENECLRKHVGCRPACTGDQTCEPDANKRTGYCAEPYVCETSLDCVDDRACGGIDCLDAISCRHDAFEPNDTNAESTDLFAQAADGSIQGSLCQQDTDFYSVTTTDVVSSDFSGQMVATLTVPKRDVGLGNLTLSLKGPDGSQIRTSNFRATPENRSVTLKTSLSDAGHGTYTLELSPGEDVTKNGLEYWLNVRIEKPGATAACDDPWIIGLGEILFADTDDVSAAGMGSTCTSEDNPAPDAVHALELDHPKDVLIRATPKTPQGDATLSVRRRCRELPTEQSCTDQGGPGESESLRTILGEGTHYIVVQAPAGSSLGPYEVKVEEKYPTACGPRRHFCVDRSTSAVCDNRGHSFIHVSCEDACNPTFGKCFDW